MMLQRFTIISVWLFVSACSKAPEARAIQASSSGSQASQGTSCAIPSAQTEVQGRSATNLDGNALAVCGTDPMTGVYRNGRCATGNDDLGVHVVCAKVTDAFLSFTAGKGNDLSSPRPGFAGLKPGDHWCLCAARWAEADAEGKAPPVILEATEKAALRTIARERLLEHRLVQP